MNEGMGSVMRTAIVGGALRDWRLLMSWTWRAVQALKSSTRSLKPAPAWAAHWPPKPLMAQSSSADQIRS